MDLSDFLKMIQSHIGRHVIIQLRKDLQDLYQDEFLGGILIGASDSCIKLQAIKPAPKCLGKITKHQLKDIIYFDLVRHYPLDIDF